MKKLVFPLVILFLVVFVSTASAQEKKYEILLGGGIDSPLRPEAFQDGFNLGWTGKLAAGYFLSPQFALGGNVSFNRFGLDEGNVVTTQNNLAIDGGDLTILEFAGVGKYYFMPSLRSTNIYLLGGPGIAFSRTSDFTVTDPNGSTKIEGDSVTDFMFTAGVGVKHNLNTRWGLFVEGRYSHIFTEGDNTSYLPIRVGVIF